MTDSEPKRPGPPPSPDLRAAIMQAALELFAEHGVAGATTRAIASRAGTTERTLFKHFGAKDRLASAVLAEASIYAMQAQAFARVLADTPFTPKSFQAWHLSFLRERIAGAKAAPDNYRLLFRELLTDPALTEGYAPAWRENIFAPVRDHLERMQKQGGMETVLPAAVLAGAFYSLNVGYLVSRFALRGQADWDDERDAAAVVRAFAGVCGWR